MNRLDYKALDRLIRKAKGRQRRAGAVYHLTRREVHKAFGRLKAEILARGGHPLERFVCSAAAASHAAVPVRHGASSINDE